MDTKTQKILDEAKVLILDIEATSLDIDTAVTRVVGVKTNQSSKIHCIWAKDFDKLRSAIKKADFVVTYNGENYDIPVLMNEHNRLFKYETTMTGKHLDLYDVVTKRESTFGVKFLDGFSLDAVCKSLGLSRKVQDFDYKLLRKDYEELTSEEIAEIEHYLRQDVNITYELYQFLEEMFQPLTAFLPERDIRKKNYIKSSMGAVTYKVICHMSGLQPTYDSSYEDDNEDTYVGGHVFEPIREETKGNIKCVDYASAYPHAYMQANLYTKCKFCTKGECQYRFNGGTTPDGHVLQLQGNYCTKHGMGVRERVIQKLFMLRLDAKNKIRDYQTKKNHGELLSADQENNLNYLKKLQQGLKIIINTIYGISGSPKFLQTYDEDTAADCTLICRFNLIYMHTKLTEFGHECLYGDSVVGDTIIDVAGIGPMKIEDLFTNVDYTQGDKEYCILDGVQTPTITNDFKHSMRNVPYIMRHKTDKPIYRVWTGKHSYVDVTEDHSLIGFKNKSMVEVKPTDIDCALIAQKHFDNVYKVNDVSPLVHQFIGLFLGDGSFEINNGYTGRNLNISCGNDFKDINDKYFTPLIEDGWIDYIKKHGEKADYRIYGKIADYIRELHLKDISKKRFDISYMYGMPTKSKCAMLRGLFDSDGTVINNGTLIRFCNIEKEFCKQIKQLLKEVGIHATIYMGKTPNDYNGKCSNTYSVYVNVTSKSDFKNLINFDVTRKSERLDDVKSNGGRHIDDIVRTYATKIERIDHNGYVYDIEVEDTHKFFANGILVHNTDSAYVKCEDGVKDIDIQGQLDEILANLKSIYPFPQDTFKIDIEDSMKYMGFFGDECGGFKKKKYIMVLDNDEVKVKGLSVVRRDSSLLARKIWNQYITDYIKTNLTHKIPLNNIEIWITDLLEEDLANAAVEFKVKPLDMYNSMTSIQARISKEYGEGKHKMIKNRRGIGVGKGVSYAPLEQAKNLKIRDLDLSRVYSDLSDVTDNGQTTFNRFTI
jgi:DNA polymerase elongation subunit (family B)